MTPKDIAISELKSAGYELKRNGSNHDIYFNAELKCAIPVKRHQFTENTLRYIRKEIKQNERRGV